MSQRTRIYWVNHNVLLLVPPTDKHGHRMFYLGLIQDEDPEKLAAYFRLLAANIEELTKTWNDEASKEVAAVKEDEKD